MSKLRSIAIASSIVVAACAAPQAKPVTAPDAQEPEATHYASPAPSPDGSEGSVDRAAIEVAETIRRACGLSVMEAYFMYDSSTLGSKVQPSLDKIAKCFIDGPLAGRQIALVGHADPRGDDDYNMLLGERRAQTVDRALVSRNLASSRISTTSRGEMDAIGTDETSWALDRKVQMELAE